MGRRREAREMALQILFEAEITRDRPAEVVERFWSVRSASAGVREFAETLVLGALDHLEEIDGIIQSSADHWRLERMAVVDRNVLRMAIYELQHRPATPPAVVIDEAIEVARKFGSEESAPFINGILDAVRRRVEMSADET